MTIKFRTDEQFLVEFTVKDVECKNKKMVYILERERETDQM